MRIRLVRSRKPETVPHASGLYIERKLPSDERSAYLFAKLLEEVGELQAAWYIGSVDEVLGEGADIMEVILGLYAMIEKDERDLAEAMREKRAKYGDFKTPVLYEEYPEVNR